MKIRKLTLENVKSYQKEVIEFHDGINVIAGRNGAGKTTLIEAIGLALFGYMNKDYSYQDFISHGATSGSIMVEFEVDNCLYRIERTFGLKGTKSWTVYDLQTDEMIETHTAEDVNFVLEKLLGMKEGISLAELFERIIGVSQGTFTEPFLRSAGGRKEYFERIFMLDSYKVAYQKSSDSAGLLRGQCDDLEKELIKLRTRVEDYPSVKAQFKDEEQKLSAQKVLLKEKDKELKQAKAELQELKDCNKQIQELESQQLQFMEQQKQLEERLNNLREELQISEKACELVETYRETHQSYQQQKAKISELEARLDTQTQLESQKNSLEKEIAVISQRLETRQESLIQNRKKLLEEDAARKEELEEYSLPLESIERELKSITDELEKIQKASITYQELSQSYQVLEGLLSQLQDRLQEWNSLKAEIVTQQEHLQKIPQLEQALAESDIEKQWEIINHKISVIETQISIEEEKKEQVDDGLCPLLKTRCKTIDGENLREFFIKRVEELQKEKEEKTAQKDILTQELQNIREQEKQLIALQALQKECEDRLCKLQQVETKINDYIHSMHEKIHEFYGNLKKLKKSGYLNDAGDLTFQTMFLSELPQEIKRMQTELDIFQNYLQLSQQEIKSREQLSIDKKDELSDRRTEFVTRISQIQSRVQEIQDSMQELQNEEIELTQEAETLAEDQKIVTELMMTLQTYGDLKGDLRKAKEELNRLEEGNQIYLTYQQKAGELPIFQEQESHLITTLAEVEVELQRIAEKLLVERGRFDQARFSELENRLEELNRQFSQSQTLIEEGERRLNELTDKLKEMDQIKAKIKERETAETKVKKALDLMNFIRNVFNTSAEEIAQVFLKFISHEATNIYRQLSGENIQLIWEKDYQVKLKDKHRIRIFKQLSGGEQMSAAFAIRLALLRKFSTVRLGFFDEPTTHLDEFRRMNIAQAIANIREKGDDYFEQIFVISHDDTFTTLTESLIRIDKTDEVSYLV